MYVLLTRQPNEGKLINGKKLIEAAKNYVHIFLGKKGIGKYSFIFYKLRTSWVVLRLQNKTFFK
jgi:hypothetical protein